MRLLRFIPYFTISVSIWMWRWHLKHHQNIYFGQICENSFGANINSWHLLKCSIGPAIKRQGNSIKTLLCVCAFNRSFFLLGFIPKWKIVGNGQVSLFHQTFLKIYFVQVCLPRPKRFKERALTPAEYLATFQRFQDLHNSEFKHQTNEDTSNTWTK